LNLAIPTDGVMYNGVSGVRGAFKTFSNYYGSNNYYRDFVLAALQGTGTFNLEDKPREELTMKVLVLQEVLMHVWSNLHMAISQCEAGDQSATTGSTSFVDYAWALYANSTSKGPIKLAEKRAPQFAVEVNVRLLEIFGALQQNAQSGNCTAMKTLVIESIAKMQVPVIQGMLREAYEVDPKEVEQHQGADGFIEVVEGWAFARAVLPSIAECSTAAAQTITENMDTIALGVNGLHLKDGYMAVKAAVESTYECLGISCADVNAMVNPFKTEQLLWQPCVDGQVPTWPLTNTTANAQPAPVSTAWRASMVLSTIALALVLN
jgi:hypothetical protein